MSLRPALRAAVEAARAAGDRLARALRRGRGSPLDPSAVGDAIAARLATAHPTWPIVEPGRVVRARDVSPDAATWWVDPHDPPSAFGRGERGGAVSVGLVHAGRPVLGVVLVYAPPIGEADLFAWAEGCGPVERNGRSAGRPGPDRLGREHTVLVPASADRAPADHAALGAPARFRPVRSTAHRLALVAVGDAEAAVVRAEARGPATVAGQALLRGAAGDLYDGRGEPVRYEAALARSATAASVPGGGSLVFGGSRGVARLLARRDGSAVRAAAEAAEAEMESPLVRRRTDGGPIARRDRAIGLMMGQLAGDALGARVEFQTSTRLHAVFPGGVRDLRDGGPWHTLGGQPTDDSELALALARTLAVRGAWDREAVASAYARWFKSRPFDLDSTTATAVSRGARAAPGAIADAMEAAASEKSRTNGALSRVAPIALIGLAHDEERALEWAAADARLTHRHVDCRAANAAFVAALRAALVGARETDRVLDAALEAAGRFGGSKPVRACIEAARTSPVEALDAAWPSLVLHTLQNALHQLVAAPSVEAGVVDTVMRGGDTDTNGAVAGALLGAFHGVSSFPESWVDRVVTARPLDSSPTAHPRPPEYWPVDALELTEALLAVRPLTRPEPVRPRGPTGTG